MLSIKVEKEIKQDNHVLGDLTLRQLICVTAAAAVCAVVWAVTRLDMNALMPVIVAAGVLAGVFGWVHKDGMHAEDYLMRLAKRLVYHSGRLKYRTSNAYVRLFNRASAEERKKEEEMKKAEGRKAKKPEASEEKKKYAACSLKRYA